MKEPLEKQPGEKLLYDMEFPSPPMREGETITSVVSVTQQKQGAVDGSIDVVLGTASFSGKIVQLFISSGTDGESYLITIKITTSAGQEIEGEGWLYVKDTQ